MAILNHGQGDNVGLLALVDNSLPTGGSLRWGFRYAVGFPGTLTVYRRPHPKWVPVRVPTDSNSVRGLSAWVRQFIDGGLQTDGLHIPAGGALISFSRPMVSVAFEPGIVGTQLSTGTLPVFNVYALRSPGVVDSIVGRTVTTGVFGTLTGDSIDAVRIENNVDIVIKALQLVPLSVGLPDDPRVPVANQWSAIAQVSLDPSNPVPVPAGIPQQIVASSPGTLQAILTQLFHDQDGSGNAIAMAANMVSGAASAGPTVSIPKLGLLLTAARSAKTARAAQLLLDVTAPQVNQPKLFDYAVLGQWQAAGSNLPTVSPHKIDFGQMAASNSLPLGAFSLFDNYAALSSVAPLTIATSPTAGLQIGVEAVWLSFPSDRPAQVVQIEVSSPGALLEATAFATVGQPGEMRVVDWACTDATTRKIVLRADYIESVALICRSGTCTIARITMDEDDAALATAPNAAIGNAFFATFAAGAHALPAAPGPVTATALSDPQTNSAVNTGTPLAQRDPTHARVGINFTVPQTPLGLDFGPASYLVRRGPSSAQLTTTVAGDPDPLFVSAGQNSTAPLTIDTVSVGTTVVYGVHSLDLFGRTSADAFSSALSIVAPPLPPPVNVRALASDDGTTLSITFDWPGDPGLFDTRLTSFRLYWKAAQPVRTWTDGTVTATVDPNVTAPGQRNANMRTFALNTDIPIGSVDTTHIPGAAIQADDDSYLVDSVEGSSPLTLHLYVNASTPQIRPARGATVRIFAAAPTSAPTLTQASFNPNAPVTLRPGNISSGSFSFQIPVSAQGVSFPNWDSNGNSRLSISVSACSNNAAEESALAGPVTVQTINRSAPANAPLPSNVSFSDVFTGPPDAYSTCRYTYVAPATAGALYHVYRSSDTRLLAQYAMQRQRDVAGGGPRVQSPSGALPSGFSSNDFAALFTLLPTAPADIAATSPALLQNRDLFLLANAAGMEGAFERITNDPISAAQGTTNVSYVDATLPGGGTNRYLYRLMPISASGVFGSFSWSSAPVWLYPKPPTPPLLAGISVVGNLLHVSWARNPEPAVDRYRIFIATDPSSTVDERDMIDLGVIVAADAADAVDETNPLLSATVIVPRDIDVWVRVAAIGSYSFGSIQSAPCAPLAAHAAPLAAPSPPNGAAITVTQASNGNARQVSFSFTTTSDVGVRYSLRRQTTANAVAVDIGDPVTITPRARTPTLITPDTVLAALTPQTVALTDPSAVPGRAQYWVVAAISNGRTALSDQISVGVSP
jgi:hypothetical protein